MPRLWEMLLGLAEYETLTDAVTGNAGVLARDLFGDHPCVECLVLDEDGRLQGYALFYTTYSSFRTARCWWLEDLYVDPTARGRGYGRRLLAALAERAVARGITRIDWVVLDWNESALEFYREMGGAEVVSDWLQYRLEGDALRALAAERPAAPGA